MEKLRKLDGGANEGNKGDSGEGLPNKTPLTDRLVIKSVFHGLAPSPAQRL